MNLTQLFEAIGASTMIFWTFAFVEIAAGKFKFRGISQNNWLIDIGTYSLSKWAIPPITAFLVAWLTSRLLPQGAGALAGTPWPLQFLAFVVFEDMAQYWWHRSSHTFPKLWPLHLAHHTAPYMGVRMSSRNSFLYILLFPNHYTAGVLVYLGYGDVYVWYSAIKTTVTTAAHSELRWDAFLYRYQALRPLTWVVQRTISTPATHFAHHASDESDGIGHYSGNFGNLMFFWDVLFGTAHISQQYPPSVGLKPVPGEPVEPWYVQIFYPLFRPQSRAREIPAAPAPQPSLQ